MTALGLTMIAKWMLANAWNIQLQHLDISKNSLGDKAVHHLCVAINSCTKLRTVDLRACQLGCPSGKKIINLLQSLSESAVSCNRAHSLQVCTGCTAQRMPCNDAAIYGTSSKSSMQDIRLQQNPRLDSVVLSTVNQLLSLRQSNDNSTKTAATTMLNSSQRRATRRPSSH